MNESDRKEYLMRSVLATLGSASTSNPSTTLPITSVSPMLKVIRSHGLLTRKQQEMWLALFKRRKEPRSIIYATVKLLTDFATFLGSIETKQQKISFDRMLCLPRKECMLLYKENKRDILKTKTIIVWLCYHKCCYFKFFFV